MASNSEETSATATGEIYEMPAVISPNMEKVQSISKDLGYSLSEGELHKLTAVIGDLLKPYNKIYRMVEPKPPVKYSRTPGYRPKPEENEYNAWYVRTEIEGALEGKLHGKTVAIKDNIAVAGVQMMVGSKLMEGYIPEFDATVVHRTLEAGGKIIGKAACENMCMAGMSYTNDLAPILNPHDTARTAGGSSSGCAALLAAGHVDLAIGGDQGGSVRIPAACCGIVGLKTTCGLIPYTGALGGEYTIDTLGPMATNVKDCALLLEVLVGRDGMDGRQPEIYPETPQYSKMLRKDCLQGMKIGVLTEGFNKCQPLVIDAVKRATVEMMARGAVVKNVSIPMHSHGEDLWRTIFLEGAYQGIIQGAGFGPSSKGFHSVTMMQHLKNGIKNKPQHHPFPMKLASIMGAFLKEENNHEYYCRASNLIMQLEADYNKKLEEYDVLVMPTIPMLPTKLPSKSLMDVQRCEMENINLIQNTAPFNLTGHPALSITCGLVQMLPAGLMIVGKKWHELDILNVAYAYEMCTSLSPDSD